MHRGSDKPAHTVIDGENFHVLQALTYTHRGKVDAIYIDPPYNTGAKDWRVCPDPGQTLPECSDPDGEHGHQPEGRSAVGGIRQNR